MIGALGWCFADYAPELWKLPPLDNNPHERHFGLFRHDGTSKAAVKVWQESLCNNQDTLALARLQQLLDEFYRNSFYQDPKNNLQTIYYAWKQSLSE